MATGGSYAEMYHMQAEGFQEWEGAVREGAFTDIMSHMLLTLLLYFFSKECRWGPHSVE